MPLEPDDGEPPGGQSADVEQLDTDRSDEPPEFDPDSLGPSVPEAPSGADGTDGSGDADADVDPGLKRLFWGLVLVFNAALLAVSLGLMFVVFEGDVELGAQLVAGGVVIFAYGVVRYRRSHPARTDGDGGDTEPDDGSVEGTDA